ncbi:MAG: PEP/pyruvate-binding domain-containing protein [Anaerolineaceae bacterium]|nr:PEP/pyruvate-binding domain-containing protein [Anaerolineaceae bacterium]
MTFTIDSGDRLLSIYLALAQYPVLNSRMRMRMRAELFNRGVIDIRAFENEVREMAIRSQRREGMKDPFFEEPGHIWEMRLAYVRDVLTDLVFSQHLAFEEMENIVKEVLNERGVSIKNLMLSINPELAPQEMVFEQAMMIENMPAAERARYEPRLRESKVVLIRTLISDQLRYINIAKDWFTISDLAEIRRHKIGAGRIGGKAAGMLLALRILQTTDPDIRAIIRPVESYYIGSDELYNFMALNNLVHWNDQKYKTEEEMRAEYDYIVADFESGQFSPDIVEKLNDLLLRVGPAPLIVRSSSLLEDNFGTSFAGKYESYFLPNQASPKENLIALTHTIARVYASTLNPDALLYRRHKGLQDYDERMAILIQIVEGETFGNYFLPHGAGVAFSRNLYRWTPQIRREDGFVRLVWGLGTRAVERVGNDYPRLIALSHPLLRPSTNPTAIRQYSQQYVDLIDLKENVFKTLPVHEVINMHYPPLRYLAQLDEDGYFSSLHSTVIEGDPQKLVLTFDEMLRRTSFAKVMKNILHILEHSYSSPVDLEFTLHLENNDAGRADLCLNILQCRPQSYLFDTVQEPLPTDLRDDDIVFSTHFVVPEGYIPRVDTVVFVVPEEYFNLPTLEDRFKLARLVGQVNAALTDEKFICIGPGRWGSSNSDLGVPISYGDIYNVLALVELAGKDVGPEPEPSLGTHFFQDLLESQIYPLAIYLDDAATVFNHKFFYQTPNHLQEWVQTDEKMERCLRVIKVKDYRPGTCMQIVMNDEMGQAIAFIPPKPCPE